MADRCVDASLFRRARATVVSMHATLVVDVATMSCHTSADATIDACEHVSKQFLQPCATSIDVFARVARRVHASSRRANVHADFRLMSMCVNACAKRGGSDVEHVDERVRSTRGCTSSSRAIAWSNTTKNSSRWNSFGVMKVEINVGVDGVVIAVRARSRSIRSRTQVFLQFFLNIIEQTNYDSP